MFVCICLCAIQGKYNQKLFFIFLGEVNETHSRIESVYCDKANGYNTKIRIRSNVSGVPYAINLTIPIFPSSYALFLLAITNLKQNEKSWWSVYRESILLVSYAVISISIFSAAIKTMLDFLSFSPSWIRSGNIFCVWRAKRSETMLKLWKVNIEKLPQRIIHKTRANQLHTEKYERKRTQTHTKKYANRWDLIISSKCEINVWQYSFGILSVPPTPFISPSEFYWEQFLSLLSPPSPFGCVALTSWRLESAGVLIPSGPPFMPINLTVALLSQRLRFSTMRK